MTGALGAFAAIGHMTVPSLAGAAIDRHGYAALMPLLCALNGVGLALLTAVARRRTATLPAPPHSLHLHASACRSSTCEPTSTPTRGAEVPCRREGGGSVAAANGRRRRAEMQPRCSEMQPRCSGMQPRCSRAFRTSAG